MKISKMLRNEARKAISHAQSSLTGIFTTVIILTTFMPVQAQNCPATFTKAADGDYVVSAGTKSLPCTGITEIEADVLPTPVEKYVPPSYKNSWLCPDSNCIDIPITNTMNEVTKVRITRTDGVAQDGGGEVARYDSWVLIDNIDIRRGPSVLKVWNDVLGQKFHLQVPVEILPKQVIVVSSSGEVIHRVEKPVTTGSEIIIDYHVWSAGVYYLKVSFGNRSPYHTKILKL